MQTKITPVILSGGSGTRLWPVSTAERPKQFLPLTGETSLFQQAVERVGDSRRFNAPVVVANAAHIDIITEQMAAMGREHYQIIVETAGRNTAPAITLAALSQAKPATPILVLPSDQVITDRQAFTAAVDAALPKAMEKWLFTFGLEPTGPETGYGYLKSGAAMGDKLFEVAQFVEKPDLARAQEMLADGGYRWNAGIFLMRADCYAGALKTHAPDIHACCLKAIENAVEKGHSLYPDAESFEASPSDSIDYAVMEKADHVAMVSVSMGWSDLGNWEALHGISDKDAADNAVRGACTLVDSSGCYVRTDKAHISLLGVSDLVVIAQGDDIVILPRAHVQRVKELAAHSEIRR